MFPDEIATGLTDRSQLCGICLDREKLGAATWIALSRLSRPVDGNWDDFSLGCYQFGAVGQWKPGGGFEARTRPRCNRQGPVLFSVCGGLERFSIVEQRYGQPTSTLGARASRHDHSGTTAVGPGDGNPKYRSACAHA